MLVWKFTKYGDASTVLEEFEDKIPKPNSGEVLVKLTSVSLNPVDYKIVKGNYKMVQKVPMPSSLGYDFAGELVAVGPGVEKYAKGDQVFGCLPASQMGSLSEYLIAPEGCFCKQSDSIDSILFSAFPLAGMTALQCLEVVKLGDGAKVLIHAGSGGVGSLAIQLAKAMNYHVTTTTSSKNKDWVQALGADRVISYDKEDYKSLSNEFDMVLDSLGGKYSYEAAGVLKTGGYLVNIAGGIDEKAAKRLGVPAILRWMIKMQRFRLRRHLARKNISYHYVLMQTNEPDLIKLRTLLDEQQLKPVVEHIYNWSQVPEAFEHLMSGRAKGKLIVRSTNN